MARKNPEHEAKSLALADNLLRRSGFTEHEMRLIVHEIIDKKLFFDDVKHRVRPHYEALKLVFSKPYSKRT